MHACTHAEPKGSAAVPHRQSLPLQASRRAVASMWAHLRAFANLGVPRTGEMRSAQTSPGFGCWTAASIASCRRPLALTAEGRTLPRN